MESVGCWYLFGLFINTNDFKIERYSRRKQYLLPKKHKPRNNLAVMDRDKKKLVFTLSLQRRLLDQHYTASLNPPLGVEDWRSTVYMINHCSLASKGQCLNCPFLQDTETKFLHKANHIHVYWFFNMKFDIKRQ